jgi:hypothetical protein
MSKRQFGQKWDFENEATTKSWRTRQDIRMIYNDYACNTDENTSADKGWQGLASTYK